VPSARGYNGAVAASTQEDFSRALTSYLWVLGGLFAAAMITIPVVLLRFRAGSRRTTGPP
jgi:hypothetical protein